MMWGNGFGWGGFGLAGMLVGGVMMVIFWGGLIALGLVVMRALTQTPTDWPRLSSQSENRALEILKERYARGEVTKEQYEDMRRDLS